MIRRIVFLVTAFIALSAQTRAADFDRRAFLAAVKERFKSDPALMRLESPSDPILFITSDPAKTEGWQKDLVNIPDVSLPIIGQNASFGIALAYLTSQELKIPFSSRGSDSLIWLVGTDRNPSVVINGNLTYFGTVLLRTVFDETHSCTIQDKDLRGTAVTIEFANSICRDLKQVLAESKAEFESGSILASEKQAARTAIQRTQDLLKQTPDYANHTAVEASITSLEASLAGNDLKEIREQAQGLTTASQDLETFAGVQRASDEALTNAREAGNQELTRTRNLLGQDHGYPGKGQLLAAKNSLELAIAGEDVEEIKAKTHALEAANRELDQFAQAQIRSPGGQPNATLAPSHVRTEF